MVMKYFVCIFLSILFLFQPEVRANSQSKYDSLFQEFDARSFNYNEKRMIQLALALSGDYRGLLDGKWGRISQTAFEQYTRKKFSLEPINFHLASLFSDFIDERGNTAFCNYEQITSPYSEVKVGTRKCLR
jgi:hypothetical protein